MQYKALKTILTGKDTDWMKKKIKVKAGKTFLGLNKQTSYGILLAVRKDMKTI